MTLPLKVRITCNQLNEQLDTKNIYNVVHRKPQTEGTLVHLNNNNDNDNNNTQNHPNNNDDNNNVNNNYDDNNTEKDSKVPASDG